MNLWRQALLLAIAPMLLLAGCSAKHYRKSADKEVYSIIKAKAPLVTNMPSSFTIEHTNQVFFQIDRASTNAPDFLGQEAAREVGAGVLMLEQALLLAIKTSRQYQSEKEDLYLSALSLTLARHRFAPLFSSSASITHGVDEITERGNPLNDRVINDADAEVNASWLIRDVGRITTDFTTDALRLVTMDGRVVTSSRLGARFTRPLLQNAGYKAEMEALTQAERDFVYELRAFVQFRKDFAVNTARDYYAVLGDRDVARNNFLNFQSSRKNAERSRALAQEGRITQSDLGRLEQQELSAESSWINAVRSYQESLDNFKLSLGLNVSNKMILDDGELESLRIMDPNVSPEDSVQIALAARIDYLNAKDQFEDSVREVDLRQNFLKPQLDFSAGVELRTDPQTHTAIAVPDPSLYAWDAGLRLDPGLDRKAERNNYARALIARNRAARNIEQTEDVIRIQVRQSWRSMEQAKRNYEIAEVGVRLAERRVEEQNILAELGRVNAQDQVDAQNDLIDSKNKRTVAIVGHTMARLTFWNRLGILFIKDDGRWENTNDVETKESR